MSKYAPAAVPKSELHVGDSRIELALNEATAYGEHFPTLGDGRTIDIKKLAVWTHKAMRNAGVRVTVQSRAAEPAEAGKS